MVTSGLMSIDYDDSATKTALQTFHDRVGNCMSFTSLFVVLAREAGLQVTFQKVAVPPIWQADSDLIILNDHVNALVRQKFEKRVVVDFNATELKANYETEPVSDTYAQALYFNNIAMDALREVGPGAHFLGCGHTQSNFETAFYRSSIADNNSFEQWEAEGSLDASQRANALWKKALADYVAPAIDPAIDEELQAYVDRRKAEGGVPAD